MAQSNEIVSILEQTFGEVRGNYPQFRINCPCCAERDKISDDRFNLEITLNYKNTNRPVFHCWKCEPTFSGSLGKLFWRYGTKTSYELYKSYISIYENFNYSFEDDEKEYLPPKLPTEMIYFSEMDVTNLSHFEAYNYLINERKLDRETILKYNLGFCVSGKFNKRIIIPSYDINNQLNYFIGRSYDPKQKKYKYLNSDNNKSEIIFWENNINFESTVFICEGVFDGMSLPNAMPLLGKTLSYIQLKKISAHKPQIVILLDPDAVKNAIELFYNLKHIYYDCEEKIKIVVLPNNDDVDELRRKKGIDEVIKYLYTARDLITDDYFINKLQKPYVKYERNGRFNSNSKYSEWKSGESRNFI